MISTNIFPVQTGLFTSKALRLCLSLYTKHLSKRNSLLNLKVCSSFAIFTTLSIFYDISNILAGPINHGQSDAIA